MKSCLTAIVILAACCMAHARESVFRTVGFEKDDVRSVQAAIDAVPADNRQQKVILIRAGAWFGHTRLDKPNVTLRGTGPNTCLTFNLGQAMPGADMQPVGAHGAAALFLTKEATAAVIEDMTLENTYGKGMQAQACTVHADRVIFRRCRLLGRQDTLKIDNGRMFFENCYIAGDVDFIYGSATAFFSKCEIHCRDAGYIVAPSTPADRIGFVFEQCKITFPHGNPVMYLGRPWRESPSATFIRCELGAGIRAEGWKEWNVKPPLVRFAEYESTGPGANISGRVKWATASEEKAPAGFRREEVLGDWKRP